MHGLKAHLFFHLFEIMSSKLEKSHYPKPKHPNCLCFSATAQYRPVNEQVQKPVRADSMHHTLSSNMFITCLFVHNASTLHGKSFKPIHGPSTNCHHKSWKHTCSSSSTEEKQQKNGTASHGQESKRAKLPVWSGWEEWDTLSPLSINHTVTDQSWLMSSRMQKRVDGSFLIVRDHHDPGEKSR